MNPDPEMPRIDQSPERIQRPEDLVYALNQHAIVGITDVQGRILDVNEKFCQISKYSREELLGKDHRIINSGFHTKAFFKELWTTILAGQTWRGEIRNRAKDGSIYWVDATIVPIHGGDGKPERFIAIRADITQKKAAEESLRQTQKLESLGLLAGGIAHDFNNLLTGILGNANLGESMVTPEHPAAAYFKKIASGTSRATELTHQLLAYAGRGHATPEAIQVNRIVQEIAQLLEVSISKKTTIRYDLAQTLAPVSADASQIQQVVMNLITNAAEAIGADQAGLIVLRTREELLDEEFISNLSPLLPISPGRYTVVEVSDTGCGMPPETVQKVFDPFFTTKPSGRGLGLAAMLGILRGLKGSLKVYTEVGRGTLFRIYLPSFAEEEAADLPQEVTQAWRGKGLLLIVDDDHQVRSMTHDMAQRLGFDVLEAMDGREGVQTFYKHQAGIRAVLLNLTMPTLDGCEALQEIHRVRPDVPVILSSGYGCGGDGDVAYPKDLSGILPRPFTWAQLAQVLRNAIEGH